MAAIVHRLIHVAKWVGLCFKLFRYIGTISPLEMHEQHFRAPGFACSRSPANQLRCKWSLILPGVILFASTASFAEISVVRIASGLNQPLFVTAAPGDTDRLFIVEKGGRIRILNRITGVIESVPYLTVGGLVTSGERGLLGMAFHPDYNNVGSDGEGKFFVSYTTPASTVAQYMVSDTNPNLADPTSGQRVISISQPQSNHNGGWIGFNFKVNATDSQYLYIGIGDGGSSDDLGTGHTAEIGNGQDITNNLLGKILRVDVNGDDFEGDPDRNYAIPASNPFVGVSGDDEIWAYGIRNPWRSSFDRHTGDLFIGDVGQGAREEINFQRASSAGGENYGWRLREGTIQTPGSVGGDEPDGVINPIYDYHHGSGDLQGHSVTGGYVYRGPIAELWGLYFFADYTNDRIWSLRFDGSDPSQFDGTNFTDFTDWTSVLVPDVGSIGNIASFGEDTLGNLYIVDIGGEVFMIVPEPASSVLLLLGLAWLCRRPRHATISPALQD